MPILEPDWNQNKPTYQDARAMCDRVALTPLAVESEAIDAVLIHLRLSHSNGGAILASFQVGPDRVFDWYASRNRLLEWDILPSLLRRDSVRGALPDLMIPLEVAPNREVNGCGIIKSEGFRFDNPFLLDGQLAAKIFSGGAYSAPQKIEGKEAKQLAISFCDAVFEQRYGDVSLFTNFEAWTPWFNCIAWDWTSILFDRRDRKLWILAVTDID